jgi:hypothetical protein
LVFFVGKFFITFFYLIIKLKQRTDETKNLTFRLENDIKEFDAQYSSQQQEYKVIITNVQSDIQEIEMKLNDQKNQLKFLHDEHLDLKFNLDEINAE